MYGQQPAIAIPASQRDNWRLEAANNAYDGRPLYGLATWFDATKNDAWYTQPNKWGKAIKFYGAAGPALRKIMGHKYMMEPYAVTITSELTGRSVKVWVTDYCGCHGRKNDPSDTRLIDLSPDVWDALGVDLGVGVMKITLDIKN